MQIRDKLIRLLLGQVTCFRDVLNLVFRKDGFTVPLEGLKPLDPTLEVPVAASDPAIDPKSYVIVKRIRDILYTATIMSDDKANYVLVGIEAQTAQAQDMPLRVIVYDALTLVQQAVTKKRKNKKDKTKLGEEDFLSGYSRKDKYKPVLTFVLNLSGKPWKAPKRLSQLYEDIDPRLMRYVLDYEITVISPEDFSDEDLLATDSDIGLVLGAFKYMYDTQGMKNFVQLSKRFDSVEENAARLITVASRLKFPRIKKGENINMTTAFEQWIIDSKLEGKREGIIEGKLQGERKGKREGKREAKLEAVRNIMHYFKCSFEEAMRSQKIPAAQWEGYRAKLDAV